MKLCDVLPLALDLLLPPRCAWCGEIVPPAQRCGECAPKLAALRLSGSACLVSRESGRCCGALAGVSAALRYTGIAAEAVKRYKFHRGYCAADAFAAETQRALCESGLGTAFDVVTAVPEYRAQRGRRHAALLAKKLARRLGLPFDAKVIVKRRRSEIQHFLDPAERADNLSGAFAARNVAGRRVLLCDDIVTSGHTLNECALALRAAGAVNVAGAVLCAAKVRDCRREREV